MTYFNKKFNNIERILFAIILLVAIHANANESYNKFEQEKPDNVSDNSWNSLLTAVQRAKLLPSPNGIGGEDSNFGFSVSVDGDRALVSATFAMKRGAVYVLDYDGKNWNETTILQAPDSELGDLFGFSVSLQGNRALIGASGDRVNGYYTGSAYIFEFSSDSWVQTAKLTADDGEAEDRFGSSVSLSGDRVLIGARNDEDNGQYSGSAYIFDLSNGNWLQTTKLISTDGSVEQRFGWSVSLSGNRALIGAYGDRDNGFLSGAAYIFDLTDGKWEETIKLAANDTVSEDYFGYSVSLFDDRALIGAKEGVVNSASKGSAYVFDYTGGDWSQTTKLIASDGENYDNFGWSVSLSGNRALIGATGFENEMGFSTGAAYIFDFSAGNWSQTIKLTSLDVNTENFLGQSVSLSGNRALIGTYNGFIDNISSGTAYVFDLTAVTWLQTAKLTNAIGAAYDYFGRSVSISGNRALIGAYGDDEKGSESGSAYIFEFDSGSWLLRKKLISSDGAPEDKFGYSVSLSGDRALIGAHLDDFNHVSSGSVYVFEFIEGDWLETAKLNAEDTDFGSFFGSSVSLSSNRALIGADGKGAAYIFDLSSGKWSQTAKLIAEDGEPFDRFGIAVSLSGDRALIGAEESDGIEIDSGSAYIFDLIDGSWSQTTKLSANDGERFSNFGYSVSLFNNRALIGAPKDSQFGAELGAAYIFDLTAGSWSQTSKLIAENWWHYDRFGFSVSLYGDRALIGAPINEVSNKGEAMIFDFISGIWSQTTTLTANDGVDNNFFGSSVSLSDDLILIGASNDDANGFLSGSVYVFGKDAIFQNGFEK